MEIISRKEAKELGLKRYFTGKPCKRGHISERSVSKRNCFGCHAEYRKNNKEKIKSSDAEYKKNNKERIKSRLAEYYKNNKDKFAEYHKSNKDKIAKRKAKYHRENPERIFVRDSMRRIVTNWRGGRAKAESVIGYTYEDLRQHLESQFQDGMTWDNRSEWHIDHIKPIKAFLDEGITDPAVINALDNLQPLWAHENLSKGAKWEMENAK